MNLRSQALNSADVFRIFSWVVLVVGCVSIFAEVAVVVDRGLLMGVATMIVTAASTLALWAFLTLAAVVMRYVAFRVTEPQD